MQGAKKLYLTICDNNKRVVCSLYDNQSNVSGQATNVHITKERNGWKELYFDIPSTCETAEGRVDNERLNYLIAEYLIKAETDNETDWYMISEPEVKHNSFSKNVSVKAGHISQTLKNKNTDLEFSDEEGNNVGTALQILTTILEGSGWSVGYVEPFKEDDGSIKVRSISGQAGTGALGFIDQLCDVFDAKPVYHGDTQTVDIVSMNPFKDVDPKQIASKLIGNEKIIELTYNRNTHDLNKKTNTTNMATRLSAYGSYGDRNGICTLQNAEHSEYTFTVSTTGSEYCFEDLSEVKHYFKGDVASGDVLIYSDIDLTSVLYIWNETQQEAYRLYDEPEGAYVTLSSPTLNVVRNCVPFILGLQYYCNVGLIDDDTLQDIALYQRSLPAYYQTSEQYAEAYINGENELSEIAEHNTGLLKLSVASTSMDDGFLKLTLNTANDGIIYRTDYDVAERRYFQWHVARSLKPNGLPTSGTPSVVIVVHDTAPITWDKAYVKSVYDSSGNKVLDSDGNSGDFIYSTGDHPTALTLWTDSIRFNASTDRVYLFCTDSMSGLLGARLAEGEGLADTLYNTAQKHTTQFWDADSSDPQPGRVGDEYEWLYEYHNAYLTPGDLYFCWKTQSGNYWRKVYLQNTEPTTFESNQYYYNEKHKRLYLSYSNAWHEISDTAANRRVIANFEKVVYLCKQRDLLYKGIYKYYKHTHTNQAAGRYAFPTDFGYMWVFKTDMVSPSAFVLDTTKGQIQLTDNITDIVSVDTVQNDTVTFPLENELERMTFYTGGINPTTGVDTQTASNMKTNTFKVWANTSYTCFFPYSGSIVFYDKDLKFLRTNSGTGYFTTTSPPNARFARVVSSTTIEERYKTYNVHVVNAESVFFKNDEMYTILSGVTTNVENNELIGINPLMKRFADLADTTFGVSLPAMKAAQANIKTANDNLSAELGICLKDGRWQDSNYVKNDEKRLYKDAMDMLREISNPDVSYSFTYLDLYGNKNPEYFETHDVPHPDVDIDFVAHLIDPEIKTNCWAYIDKVDKWYKQEWKTTVEIDTKLTLAARHSFTDVIARIAEIAKQISAKQSQYDNAINGNVNASRLEGRIAANQVYLSGGASNWYTDDQGNIIFEAADGLSAMMLSGRGFGVASSKDANGSWQWRTAASGFGITADEIITGYLSADRLEAGSITTDKLSSNLGQELEISSNKALTLFATSDGTRPAGALRTTDAKIQISAGHGNVPAKIDIASGGELNLTGSGGINISSGGSLDVSSTGDFTLASNGATLNGSEDGIYIGSDGVNFGGGKFKVEFTGDSSNVTMDATLVNIGNSKTLQGALDDLQDEIDNIPEPKPTYTCSSTDILTEDYDLDELWVNTDDAVKLMYVCTSVSNPKTLSDWTPIGTAKMKGAKLEIDAVAGTITMGAASAVTIGSGSTFTVAANDSINLTTAGTVLVGNGTKPFTIGGNSTHAYIRYNKTSLSDANPGVYISSTGIALGESNVFKVTDAGALTAANATITGDITARSFTLVPDAVISGTIPSANVEGLTNAIATASAAAATVEPFTHDGLTYGTTWGGTQYGVVLSNSSTAKPMLIGSNSGITIAKSQTSSDGAALVIDKTGIALHAGAINLTTTSGNTTTNAVSLSSTGITLASTANITIASGGYLEVLTNTFGIATRGNSDGTGDYVLWSGNATPASANFWIKKDGSIKAKSGTIGNWTIGADTLSSGSTTGKVVLNSKTSDTYAIWAGANTGSDAPFSVSRAGAIKSISGEIGGWTIGASALYNGTSGLNSNTAGAYLGTDGLRVVGDDTHKFHVEASSGRVIIRSGKSSISETTNDGAYFDTNSGIGFGKGKFIVTTAGALTSISGTIGGWTIASKTLKAGSGTTTVCLNADTSTASTKDYAMWAGMANPSTTTDGVTTYAPFRLKRDGSLYATKFMTYTEPSTQHPEGVETEINLSRYPLWKLNYATVKSIDVTGNTLTISTTAGTTEVNFLNASSVSIEPGGAGVVLMSNGSQVTGTFKPVEVQYYGRGTKSYSASSHTLSVPAVAVLSQTQLVVANNISVSDGPGDGLAYDAGEAAGEVTGANSVGFESETLWSDGSKTYTLTNGKTKTVSIPNATNWSSTYVQNGNMSVSCLVGAKAISSGAIADPGYSYGVTDGQKSVTATIGSWSSGSATISLSSPNTNTYTVTIPNAANWSITNAAAHAVTVSCKVGGKTISNSWTDLAYVNNHDDSKITATASISYDSTTHKYTANASAKYDGVEKATNSKAGGTEAYEAGQKSVTATVGSWSSGSATISLSSPNTNTYTATIPNATNWSITNAAAHAVTVSCKVGGKTISNSWTSLGYVNDHDDSKISAAASISYNTTTHKYTASASAKYDSVEKATDSKAGGTEAYEAGQKSVTATVGSWSSGSASITLSSPNTNSYTATIPDATNWSISNSAAHAVTVGFKVGGKSFSKSWTSLAYVNNHDDSKVGATASISYNSTTHKYTAGASATYDGVEKATDSKAGGTEAYEAGQSSVTISSVAINGTHAATATSISVKATASNGNTGTGDISISTQRTNAYNAGWAAAAAKFRRSGNTVYGPSAAAGGSDRSFTANYTASTYTPSSYTKEKYSASTFHQASYTQESYTASTYTASSCTPSSYNAGYHYYKAPSYTPSSATKIAANMWQDYVASKYSAPTHYYTAPSYTAEEYTASSYTASSITASTYTAATYSASTCTPSSYTKSRYTASSLTWS